MAFEYRELQDQLLDVGRKLADPPASVDQLISLLTRADSCLARVEQSPKDSMRKALDPTLKALVEHRLLRHPDTDVQVALASCITEITRITAPDAPYDDDQMKEIFQLVVSSFEKLHDISSRSYAKRRAILETVAKVRSCVVMLDLECDGLILEMFQHFLKAIREHHPENVFSSMETIMTLVLEESEEISFDLLSPLLDSIKKDNEEVSPIARKLAERVIENCTTKLKPYLVQAVRMLDISVDDYSKVLASICQDTCDSLEKNGVCVTSDHKEEEIKSAELPPEESSPEDETKSAELPLEESSPVVVKEEDAHSPQDNQEGNRSSKSVTNNGVASAGEDATLGDHKSITKTEDTDFSDHSKEELNDLGDGKVDKNERKPEQATKKSRRKSSSSTKSAKLSQCQVVANEKKAEKMLDSESYSKEAHNDESEVVASLSPSDSLPDENHSEKLGKAKTKGSPANVEVVSKKISEGASISKAKPVKRPVKKTLGRSSGVKKTAGTDSDKTQSGAVSSADAKKHSAKKLNDNEGGGGGSSSRQLVDEKKLGWGEANSETGAAKSSSVGVDKEMVSSPRSDTKSSENEKLEETTKTSAKRKHALEDEKLEETPKTSAKRKPAEDEKLGETPKTSAKRKPASGRKNGSGVKEYGENLVGLRVEVWWPKDREFYKGVIERFDPIKKKHKVVYDDGEVEVLNLSRQKWNIIEADSVADGEEGSDHASLDASPEMPTKKKGKTSFGEPTKHGKLSSSGGASGSSKSKGVLMSGQKSKDGNKSKESNTVSDSEDEVSRKFKDNTPASAAPKITSKSKNIGSSKTSKPKDNDTITPKPSVKSKQETSKSGATNQKTPKTAASEGKPPNSGGKSSVDRGGKLKSGSLKKRVLEDDDSDDSAREEEYTKGKTSGSSKAEGSEVKRGNKRQRS
ncbi:sister chromatid cohesion protein PDS5 homolog C-like isoform X2 [Vicia villosa]|uniref:sister chromatid cohesion protein PDS5 homolog C-like isoform X2 n=1 Tax=Vicia villosa TaxID=3911 RepID=UPI00273CA589|nr:sister chromatid cohesion protein PDS5 homolog C-like isoform X2 [Vicia villosa]